MKRRRTMNVLIWLAVSLLAAVSPAQQIPRQSPDFTALTAAGKPLQLNQFRGKPLVVEFLLTECPHCQETAQVLERLQKEYRARGLQVIAVAFNQDAQARLPGLVKKLNLSFPVGSASQLSVFQYLQMSFTRQYSVPFLAFIDGSGVIRAQFTGGDAFFKDTEGNMRSNIEALLKRGTPSGTGTAPPAKLPQKKR
ncbi:MAG: TlpA family protein disulfide reductase [Chloroflexi bacterium]|nr:TlpA family protein disulfide reductase [Chloroflexota bacterium]